MYSGLPAVDNVVHWSHSLMKIVMKLTESKRHFYQEQLKEKSPLTSKQRKLIWKGIIVNDKELYKPKLNTLPTR